MRAGAQATAEATPPAVIPLTGRKLHLGCFDQAVQGWWNTDITPHLFVARVPGLAYLLFRLGRITADRYSQHRRGVFRSVHYLDVTRHFPFPEGSFDCAYSSHMLEHLPRAGVEFCLREVRRVLGEGGVFRVAVPDLDDLIGRYRPEQAEDFLEELFEAQQESAKNRHHWHFNETSLTRSLRRAGFSEVKRYSFREGRCPDLDRIETRPGSLFVEATR